MDEFSDTIEKCLKILDENIDILSNLELEMKDEKEDEIIPNLELFNLYDMTEDIAEAVRLKHAESKLIRRKINEI